MTERIGSFLDDGEDASDKNLVNFAMVCRSTRNAIIHCKSPVWRERFSKRYEMVPGYSALELRKEYQERQMIIRKDTEVVAGKTDEELEVVNLLKKLIIGRYNPMFRCSRLMFNPTVKKENLDCQSLLLLYIYMYIHALPTAFYRDNRFILRH